MYGKNKFRAYDKQKKLMIYDGDQNIGKIYDILPGDYLHNTVWFVGNYYNTLMQSTGLKDISDKDIWENDIVQFKGIDVVIYDNGQFKLKNCGVPLSIAHSELQIIGNIYQNFELLFSQELLMPTEYQVKNIIAFLAIIFGDCEFWHKEIMKFSPAYLIEKFNRYIKSTYAESDWGLHPSLRMRVFEPYCHKYKLPVNNFLD